MSGPQLVLSTQGSVPGQSVSHAIILSGAYSHELPACPWRFAILKAGTLSPKMKHEHMLKKKEK